MVEEPIEESYFNWLCAKVLDVHIPIYWDLMLILHKTEYIWIVHGDHNREADGKELRLDFLRESFIKKEEPWFNNPCSVLEFLIAFAKRASFQTDNPLRDWFWTFLTNLGLNECTHVTETDIPAIEGILQRFLWRTYSSNGEGGMFPLRNPPEDQRKVEIWYQFAEYLLDQGL